MVPIDLSDPMTFLRPDMREAWSFLRRRHPLYWNDSGPGGGFWAVTRYRDVVHVCQNPRTYSSEGGIRIDADPAAVAAAAGRTLLVTDPPQHTVLRKAHAPCLGPAVISTMSEAVNAVVAELVARALAPGECDFVEAVAKPMASRVACRLVGVPEEDSTYVAELTERALAGDDHIASNAANAELFAYCSDLLDMARQGTVGHLVAALAEGRGARLSDDQVIMNLHGLFLAANETVRYAVAGGAQLFMERPDVINDLAEHPETLATGVEEVLRWTSPGMHVMRTATEDTLLAGQRVRKGERVVVWFASANQDETVFASPETFDIRRAPNRHLAFGVGSHFCIGAHLARLQLRAVFGELVRRVGAIRGAGTARRHVSNHLQGLDSLPVRLYARTSL